MPFKYNAWRVLSSQQCNDGVQRRRVYTGPVQSPLGIRDTLFRDVHARTTDCGRDKRRAVCGLRIWRRERAGGIQGVTDPSYRLGRVRFGSTRVCI